jgi:hypothetical protein
MGSVHGFSFLLPHFAQRVEAGSGTGNSDGEKDKHSVINLAGFLTKIPINK